MKKGNEEITILVGICEESHRVRMRVQSPGPNPDARLKLLIKAYLHCPHCQTRIIDAVMERHKPS